MAKQSGHGTCPKCRRVQYYICGTPNCEACKDRLPAGKKEMLISNNGNDLSCPYCGFTESGSWWEERSIESFIKSMGASSLTEAVAIDQKRHSDATLPA